mmetsp:Transcript_30407/g.40144  ORF Transcript_30407/g.40144 Transcript_30407/m.40144 type:complete len:294 (-) Transcript_30407:8-889(-)|eukprot:CAMPEP_0117764266 /NCGR_PEP_ID=MMETSP0947-20121206/19266_1 /TAXON_ID=44440 /ORGANISM="Chattonella subsalsa, Strain CCMP2191" /LENGTH=293 /DNA_ID=CAMNT_0005586401 /DNA_START=18 /DNA_END=899 /DNA_ORIENTATION=+
MESGCNSNSTNANAQHQVMLGQKRERTNSNHAEEEKERQNGMKRKIQESQKSLFEGCELLLFDMDGTLYSQHCGYATHITQNVLRFMENALGIENAEEVQNRLFQKYNQTLRGLKAEGYEFESSEYWERIMVGREQFISEDKELKELLSALPQRKWIFTNASEGHAKACLECLGATEYFEGIIGADFLGDVCKPEEAAFSKVIDRLKVNPQKIVFFEDSFKNLKKGQELGMKTVYIQSQDKEHLHEPISKDKWDSFDAVIPKVSLLNLKQYCPNLHATCSQNQQQVGEGITSN